MSDLRRSRPARLAAEAVGARESEALARLDGAVLVGLAPDLTRDPDARETFLFALNQCLRFVGRVAATTEDDELAGEAQELARAITGAPLATVAPDITLIVGTAVEHERPTITVCSDGWLARLATSASSDAALPRCEGRANIFGALAAGCLGVSQVFHFLAGLPLASESIEISLWEFAQGPLGSLGPGPPLPDRLSIDALLVGCGGVMHGFVYALRRLPVVGQVRVVDRQRVRDENLGPYVLATLTSLGWRKADVIKAALPSLEVTTYDEDFYPLFTTRFDRGHIPLPPLVVAGLDAVPPRHIVQRLWPELLLDVGAGGETSQLIVKPRATDGACVLELLDLALGVEDAAAAELGRLSADSGLRPRRIRDAMDKPITPADVAAAPEGLRAEMEAARRRGELRCGFIRSRALDHEEGGDDFDAAAPFVVALSGIAACAAFVRSQMGATPKWSRYQFSFVSLRGRTTPAHAAEECECRTVAEVRNGYAQPIDRRRQER